MPRRRDRLVQGVRVPAWCGLDRCFESGEPLFQGAGDGEQSEQGGFRDVATMLGVIEQGGA